MFTLEDIFIGIFPQIEGISWDVGTLMIGMIGLSLILMALDLVKTVFENNINRFSDWRLDGKMEGMGDLNKLRRQAKSNQNNALGDYYSLEYRKALKQFRSDD